MATIEDLDLTEISEMTVDEAIEHLRQIRLSRRTPIKKPSKKKVKAKPKGEPILTPEQAAKLLNLLGG